MIIIINVIIIIIITTIIIVIIIITIIIIPSFLLKVKEGASNFPRQPYIHDSLSRAFGLW